MVRALNPDPHSIGAEGAGAGGGGVCFLDFVFDFADAKVLVAAAATAMRHILEKRMMVFVDSKGG
jgi:hypothetical protein